MWQIEKGAVCELGTERTMVAKGILEYQPEEHFGRAVISPDRREQSRGTDEEERYQLVAMILGTYREMPGLCLRLNQAARLFGMRSPTCHIVLEDWYELAG